MKFLMDYDNIPGKGPLMLFRDNGDGTSSLATVEDVEKAIKEALDAKDTKIAELEYQIKNIPISNNYEANRYNTDDEIVLHLWEVNGGGSYDIRIKK